MCRCCHALDNAKLRVHGWPSLYVFEAIGGYLLAATACEAGAGMFVFQGPRHRNRERDIKRLPNRGAKTVHLLLLVRLALPSAGQGSNGVGTKCSRFAAF